MNMSNPVKRMDLRRAKAALPWMPRALPPHSEPRAVPPARPTPFGRAAKLALLALVLGGVLLLSAPAEAQTARILVSNVSQSADDSASLSGNDHAQLFHTGANTGATAGWVLTSLIVVSEDAEGDDFDVEICEADDMTAFPTSTCTKLDEPQSFAAGNLEFTHRGHLPQCERQLRGGVQAVRNRERHARLHHLRRRRFDRPHGLEHQEQVRLEEQRHLGAEERGQRGDPDHRQWL